MVNTLAVPVLRVILRLVLIRLKASEKPATANINLANVLLLITETAKAKVYPVSAMLATDCMKIVPQFLAIQHIARPVTILIKVSEILVTENINLVLVRPLILNVVLLRISV